MNKKQELYQNAIAAAGATLNITSPVDKQEAAIKSFRESGANELDFAFWMQVFTQHSQALGSFVNQLLPSEVAAKAIAQQADFKAAQQAQAAKLAAAQDPRPA